MLKSILLHAYLLAAAANLGAQTVDGRFPVFFRNQTGNYRDDQIFLYVLGLNAANQWCRALPDGSLRPVDPADADAPGHFTRGGVNYAAYAFPLSQAGDFKMPSDVHGGRIYISLAAPLCFPIGVNAWGGPDLLNPADPNAGLIFDWYEFTYVHGTTPFAGNTTQVDQFGFPMTAELKQDAIHYDQTVGIVLSRDEVFRRYRAFVGEAFQALAGNNRIIAPRSSPVFRAGGAAQNLLRSDIDSAWAEYAARGFALTRLGVTFRGQVVDGRLRFARAPAGVDGAGPFFLDKPSTAEVFACNGALAHAGMTTTELELGAELAAALNRGVAADPSRWRSASAYYHMGAAGNDYAAFFHSISIDNRSYGFAYDDVNDQSSVKILPNADAPTSLILTFGPQSQAMPVRARFPRRKNGREARRVSADGRAAGPALSSGFGEHFRVE